MKNHSRIITTKLEQLPILHQKGTKLVLMLNEIQGTCVLQTSFTSTVQLPVTTPAVIRTNSSFYFTGLLIFFFNLEPQRSSNAAISRSWLWILLRGDSDESKASALYSAASSFADWGCHDGFMKAPPRNSEQPGLIVFDSWKRF